MFRVTFGGIVLLTISAAANAANSFSPMKDCGSAKVLSGDTCSNVKVELSFEGCAFQSAPQLAKRIVCDGQKIKARFEENGYRYEARFSKAEDGWGGARWESLGPVKQWGEQKPAPKSAGVEKTADRQPAGGAMAPVMPPAVPPNAVATPSQPSPFKFSGFLDARYTAVSASKNPSVAHAHGESGFGLEDGAIYANYDKDRFALVADIAFRRGKGADYGDASGNESNTNAIGIGVDKSQIYMRYKLTENLTVDFGQFDTIYGVELNDSKDRLFGKTGLVYDQTLPVTHTGLMFEYLQNGAYAKAFAANPNNKGNYGGGDDNTEYGIAVGYSNELFRAQAGYMTRPVNKANGSDRGDRSLLDITAGTTLGRFSLDAEYAMVTDPSKNSLTPANTADSEDAGTGLMILASAKVIDPLVVGLRYEHVSDDPGVINMKSGDSYGATVHYNLTQELQLRTEYIGYTFKPVAGGSDINDSRFNVGALVVF